MKNVTHIQAFEYSAISMAYHEASHVICGLANFMKVSSVYIMSDKHDHGNTFYELYDQDTINDKMLSKVIVIFEVQTLYAGLIGEKIYYKDICGLDKFPMHLRIGSSNDIQEASKIINKYNLANPGKPRNLFKKQIHSDTKSILCTYWDDIKLVSHALYKHKKLDHKDVKYILTRKSYNKEFWKNRFKIIKSIYEEKDIDEKLVKNIILSNQVVII